MKNSVKKILAGTVCTVSAVAVILGGVMFSSAKAAEKDSIGAQAAINVAIFDAGIDSTDVLRTKADFEKEHGKYVFEVEFDANGNEYKYHIDAKTAEVIDSKIERDDDINEPTKASTSQTTIEQTAQETITKPTTTQPTTEVTTKSQHTTAANNKYIGIEESKKKALSNAGVAASDVTFTKAKLDFDDGVAVYDIEFYTESKKYDYEINAKTGAVIEKEIENRIPKTTTAKPQTTSAVQASATDYIGTEAAKKKALSNAGLAASDVTFTKAKLDFDDGVAVYDIEFYTESKKYDYEINAKTGAVVEKEIENRIPKTTTAKPQTTSASTANGLISVDKAKEIALSHAGFKASDITITKAKLEKEGADYEYEIEFVNGRFEYTYEINAKTGKIIHFEKEIDD